MIIGSKNKGDWSEAYVLLYLLGTRNLYAADENLERISNFCFPIKQIMRKDEPTESVDFKLAEENTVEIYLNDSLVRTMSSETFLTEAAELLPEIPRGNGSFNIYRTEAFLEEIKLRRLAAPATDISDIRMKLHDTMTGIDQVMGFSIKSYIGNKPTLLNASGATNFVYKVHNITDEQAEQINSIDSGDKILERMQAILRLDGSLTYLRSANDTFSGNMMMIDSRLEEILSEAILYSYTTGECDCERIIEHIETVNPLGYPRSGLYEYKFKKFLCAKALGMNPSKIWDGIDSANGGYIVAKSNGEVLAYHLYNRNKFEQYLFENTKLERASTSRHEYASLYRDGNDMLINLNLQIRFK